MFKTAQLSWCVSRAASSKSEHRLLCFTINTVRSHLPSTEMAYISVCVFLSLCFSVSVSLSRAFYALSFLSSRCTTRNNVHKSARSPVPTRW